MPSSDTVYIWERNTYKEDKEYNDQLIGISYYATHEYKIREYPQADGSMVIEYSVQDKTPYDKRITIASCPNHGAKNGANGPPIAILSGHLCRLTSKSPKPHISFSPDAILSYRSTVSCIWFL